ncbi:MAG: hypothetical protein J6M25_02485 [Prevotella sp.]|nr:hypothetical protein [Prevotella sp.]MBP3251497.1 hypothetical protein [Prevotella sp.]
MKKQAYMKPAMRMMKIQHQQMLCTSQITVTEIENTGLDPTTELIIFGGGSNTGAR